MVYGYRYRGYGRKSRNNSEDKILWLSKYCGKNISQNELNKKFQINELFDENWSEEIYVDCKSFEKV